MAIPNPRHAPYGEAAIQFIESQGITLEPSRLVYGENAMQAAHFAQSRTVSFAILPLSCIVGTELESSGQFAEIPGERFQPILQSGLAFGDPNEAVSQFKQFLLSDTGQGIFEDHGYSQLSDQ